MKVPRPAIPVVLTLALLAAPLAAVLVALSVGKFSSVIRPELWRSSSQGWGLSPPGRRTPS